MLNDFITQVQVEEIYDETQYQEMIEFYEWLENQNDQSGRESICENSPVWQQEPKDSL